LRSLLTELKYDPVLSERLATDDALVERVRLRFEDVNHLADERPMARNLEPVRLSGLNDASGRFELIHGTTNKKFYADHLDGYHRIFWAAFFKREIIPALYLW